MVKHWLTEAEIATVVHPSHSFTGQFADIGISFVMIAVITITMYHVDSSILLELSYGMSVCRTSGGNTHNTFALLRT